MSDTKYIKASQQRILTIIRALFGHEVNGLSLTDISERSGVKNLSTLHGDLANLQHANFAERIDGGKQWRLTPLLPQLAVTMLNRIERERSRVSEIQQRYTRDRS